MLQVFVYHVDEHIKTYEFDGSHEITIGRLPENHIPIASISISRKHVKIEKDTSGSFIIEDCNSLNGTFINNKKISQTKLNDGDKVVIGKYSVLFKIKADTIQSTPSATKEYQAGHNTVYFPSENVTKTDAKNKNVAHRKT